MSKKTLAVLMVAGLGVLGGGVLLAEEPAKSAVPATAPKVEASKADAPKADGLKAVAAAIDGYVFKFPCKGEMPETPKKGADALSGLVPEGADPKKTDNFTAEKKFGGEKGKHYLVTLRFRGVVEPMMYKDGKMDGDLFYIGGEPNNATYNIYKITVSSPEIALLPQPPGQGRPPHLQDRLHQDDRDRRRRHRHLLRRRPERPPDLQLRQARRDGRLHGDQAAVQRPVRPGGCGGRGGEELREGRMLRGA